jgi:hypothetical protein
VLADDCMILSYTFGGQYIVRLAFDAGPQSVCVCRPNLSVRAYGYGTEGFHKVSIVEIFFFLREIPRLKSLLLAILRVFLERKTQVQVSTILGYECLITYYPLPIFTLCPSLP